MRDSLLNCLLESKVRYASRMETIRNWWQNRKAGYTVVGVEEVARKYKTSDTVFFLGSGPSINRITKRQWEHVARHDTFAVNKWPIHPFVPTYYYTNYPRDRGHLLEYLSSIQSRLAKYTNTVFFLSQNRVTRRGMHPRIFPGFFSEEPVCCLYNLPQPIQAARGDSFEPGDFEETLYYRGAISLVLDLFDKLGYSTVVLLGVDLCSSLHFYDELPEMQWQFKNGYAKPARILAKEQHATMDDKNGSKQPIDRYIYAVDELYYRRQGVSLYIGSDDSVLHPRLPLYAFGGSV